MPFIVVRSGVHSPTNNSLNACRILQKYPVYNVKHQIMKVEQKKRAVKFYNHLKGSDSQTFHNKAITYREVNLEKSPLSKLVLGLCSQTKHTPQSPRTAAQLDPTKS